MSAKYETIDAKDLEQYLDDQTLILDCRKVEDYRNAHIKNAMHSHDALVESLITKGDKHRKVVIYCYHGHTSEHLAELFSGFGYTHVLNVAGGFEAWKTHQSTHT